MLTYDNEKKKVVHNNEGIKRVIGSLTDSLADRFNKPYFRLIAASIILALTILL